MQNNPLVHIEKVSKKQKEIYYACANPNSDITIINGAIRIGKTFWGIGGWFKRIIETTLESGTHEYGMLTSTTALVKSNLIGYLIIWSKVYGIKGKMIDSNYKIYIGPRIVWIRGYGANNSASYTSFQGSTFKDVFVDEGAILNEAALQVAEDRCLTYRERGEMSMIISTNPEGGTDHWFNKKYIKKYKTINCTLLDSPLFDNDTVERMRKTMSTTSFQRRILGKWVVGKGAVYEYDIQFIRKEDVPKLDYINIGVDEGRGDAYTGVATGFKWNSMADLYVIGQYYDKENKLIDNVYNLKQWAISLKNEWETHVKIIGETNPGITFDTLQDDVELLDNNGIEVEKVQKKVKHKDYKGKSAIQERIDVTNMLMATKHLYIVYDYELTEDEQMKLIGALSNAMYKNGVRRDDGTSDIDSLDAFEYSMSEDVEEIYEILSDEINIEKR